MPITKLPPHVIDQIAAGEVIERPASVVKELVENSLDAGAHSIQVDIEQGGVRLIRVRDDGQGLGGEDLPAAFATHATSKIGQIDDLERLSTLGFRGEALASIASIARVLLSSKTEGSEHGLRVSAVGGQIDAAEPVAHSRGTTVEVRDLFFTVPGRRKFLGSEATETKHIRNLLDRLALSRFDVAFSFSSNGTEAYRRRPAVEAPLKRIEDVLGADFVANAIDIDEQSLSLRLSGWLTQPTFARTRGDRQHLFVNGRSVRDRLLMAAVSRGYNDTLHGANRHPPYALYLEIDAGAVDVNVHPAKQEVRFRDSRGVQGFIVQAISNTLARATGPDAGTEPHVAAKERLGIVAPIPEPGSRPLPVTEPGPAYDAGSRAAGRARMNLRSPALGPGGASHDYLRTLAADSGQRTLDAKGAAGDEEDSFDRPLGRALAQIGKTFIVAKNRAGLIIVDMHAAHERIVYEDLKNQHSAAKVRRQQLLVPEIVELPEDEAATLAELIPRLRELGLDLERSGATRISVLAHPSALRRIDPPQLLQEILAEVEQWGGSEHLEREVHKALSTFACHSAARSGDFLDQRQMNELLRTLERTERANQCNHGRPTWATLTTQNLDSLFMRGR